MQKPNNEFVETVLMAIPADMLEEVGIEPCSTAVSYTHLTLPTN